MEESDVKYAGFWIRFVAFVIDSICVIMLLSPLGMIYQKKQIEIDALPQNDPQALIRLLNELLVSTFTGWDFWLSLLLPALAVIIFWIYKSATPGKMVLKTKIIDATTGDAPSKGQCIGRYFAYYLSILPFGMGFAWIAFDKRKQGWHDKLAGTVVIYVKS